MAETDLTQVNDLLSSKYRLAIMALLAGGDVFDFTALKKETGLTDGNLSSHMTKLETGGLISIQKTFLGKKPKTYYSITSEGKNAWEHYISFLTSFIKENKES